MYYLECLFAAGFMKVTFYQIKCTVVSCVVSLFKD